MQRRKLRFLPERLSVVQQDTAAILLLVPKQALSKLQDRVPKLSNLFLHPSTETFRFVVTGMSSSIDSGSYEKTPMLEDTWHSTTSTSPPSEEGDDAVPMLIKKEQKKTLLKPWPDHPIQWIRSPWMFLIDLMLILLATIFYSREPISAHLDFSGDITGFVPRLSQQIVTFQAYPEFISNHSSEGSLKEAREHWMKLLPREF